MGFNRKYFYMGRTLRFGNRSESRSSNDIFDGDEHLVLASSNILKSNT